MAESTSRYSWGADEHLVVQVAESMSLDANFRAMAMATAITAAALPGIIDVCPSNASLLVRFDPDISSPVEVEQLVRGIEANLASGTSPTLSTRIFEVPVWYRDPSFSRSPSAARGRRSRICRNREWARWPGRLYRGAFRIPLDHVDGGIRRRSTVHVPDGAAGTTARGP
jgi:urea carboxylase